LTVDKLAVVDGAVALAGMATPADAEQALALARHYRQECVIADETDTDPRATSFTYWQ
jgi:hypothetical protein